jgi:uncharacterized protein YjbI with pentapeptide repeats
MAEVDQQSYREVLEKAHEKFSETVRLTMLSLLGLSLFCFVVTFSTPDSSPLVADATIKLPFGDMPISFRVFLIVGPFLLSVVTVYLHIFYGYWLDLETDHQHLILTGAKSQLSIEILPTLFSLDHPVAHLLTAFIFSWLVPLVLIGISWKAAVLHGWGLSLTLLTGLVTILLIFLQIRRCPVSQRRWNRVRWATMAFIIAGIVVITVNPPWFKCPPKGIWERPCKTVMSVRERPWKIYRADLKEKWLAGAKLGGADARRTNFKGAILPNAEFPGANLESANLSEANLRNVDFKKARLMHANLQGAKLNGAKFDGANLQNANLQDTDLQGVSGLTKEQIQQARTDMNTKLPDYLK